MVSLVLLTVLSSVSEAHPLVAQARRQVQALQFSAASRTLRQLQLKPGLRRSEVLDYFELSGVVAGALGDTTKASSAFRTLLQLDPERRLSGDVSSPRVVTPFLEAKAAVREKGSLQVRLTREADRDGLITALKVELTGAPELMTRLHVDVDEDGVARSVDLPADARTVRVAGRRVSASLRAEGATGWVLFELGRVDFEAPTVPLVQAVALVQPAPAPGAMASMPTTATPRFRPAAWTVGALGAATLVTGVIFGARSALLRADILGAQQVDGAVVGMSRRMALELEQQSVTSAIVANTAFIVGSALVLGGLLLWLVGSS